MDRGGGKGQDRRRGAGGGASGDKGADMGGTAGDATSAASTPKKQQQQHRHRGRGGGGGGDAHQQQQLQQQRTPATSPGAATPPRTTTTTAASPSSPPCSSPSPSPSPSASASSFLTLRQMYDLLRLGAGPTMERAAAHLGLDPAEVGCAQRTAAGDAGVAATAVVSAGATGTAAVLPAATPHGSNNGNNANHSGNGAGSSPKGGGDAGSHVSGGHDHHHHHQQQQQHTASSSAATAATVGAPGLPTQHFVLSAVTRMGGLLADAEAALRRNRATNSAAAAAALPLEQLSTLAKVIAWFCLETAGESAVFAGIGPVGGGLLTSNANRPSQNISGRATPAVRRGRGGAGASQGRGGGGGGRGRGGNNITTTNSNSANASTTGGGGNSRFGDWAGSRLPNNNSFGSAGTGGGGGGGSARSLPDDQLAEQLFRPAIEFVVKLSTYYELDTTTATATTTRASDDLRLSAIVLLSAVIVRFPDADFHYTTFLPMLFPDQDICTGGSPVFTANTTSSANTNTGTNTSVPPVPRHPLLTPLLWDPSAAARGATSVLLVMLLCKMQRSLIYAEEPKRRQQAFMSLSTQGGAALSALHDALYWALDTAGAVRAEAEEERSKRRGGGGGGGGGGKRQPARGVVAAPTTSAAADARPPAALDSTTPLFHVYATALVVTPYNRCPHSLQTIMETLELPVLRSALRPAGDGSASTSAPPHAAAAAAAAASSEYVAAMAFLANVFKNESLRTRVADFFTLEPGSPLTPTPGLPPKPPAVVVSGGGSSGGGGGGGVAPPPKDSLLSLILAHAKDRVEVWRCVVHISRLYPALIQQHFTELIKVSADVVSALAEQEERRNAALKQRSGGEGGCGDGQSSSSPPPPPPPPPPLPAAGGKSPEPEAAGEGKSHHQQPQQHADPSADARGVSSKSPSQPAAVAVSPEAVAECLRSWLHFVGYVWRAFDGNPEDPGQRPETQGDRATLAQKGVVFTRVIRSAMQGAASAASEDVRVMTLRMLAQLGEDFMSSGDDSINTSATPSSTSSHPSSSTTTTIAAAASGVFVVTPAVKDELVAFVTAALEDWCDKVRAEAMSTIGVWAWQYAALDAYGPQFVDAAVHVLVTNTDANTRTKAAFALSNLTCRLGDPGSATRRSPVHMALLCNTAMMAVADAEPGVQGHAVRIICHLLQSLDAMGLIEELDSSSTLMTMHMAMRPIGGGFQPQLQLQQQPAGVQAQPQSRELGLGSATATSAGGGEGVETLRAVPTAPPPLHRDQPDSVASGGGGGPAMMGAQQQQHHQQMYEPEPIVECVAEGFLRVLLFILSNTSIEAKRRWNAAFSVGEALRREVVFESEPTGAMDCVAALMTAVVRDRFFKVRTQAAIALAKVASNCLTGRFSSEDMSAQVMRALCVALGSSRATDTFTQYKEQGALLEALRASLATVMTTATSSKELDRLFTEFRPLLEEEKLM